MNSNPQDLQSAQFGSARHLLFIDEHLIMGGIATLIARVSRLLLTDGWQVTLLARKVDVAVKQMLPEKLVIQEISARFKWMYFPEYAVACSKQFGLDSVDVIFGTGVVASWLGSLLSAFLPKHPKILCGVYTPWEFCYPRSGRFADYGTRMRCENFDRNISDSSKLFMSDVVCGCHAKSFGRSLTDSPICVLPIDTNQFISIPRHPDRFKIVSIGRLCPFKSYNLYMIDVVRQLRDKGHPVRWEVHGTGELEPEMSRRIKEAGLEDCIRLHGHLDYQNLGEVLSDAGAFVGMGTALIEAGFCRVPSVVALENSKTEMTYGYLYHLPLGACGEQFDATPALTTTELLERLLLMSEAEYTTEMERTCQYVQPFDQERVYQQLLRCFKNAKPCKSSYLRFAAYNLHGLYRKIFGK